MLEDLKDGDFAIGTGRYYVDGVLCENESYVKYTGQPCLPNLEPTGDERSLVYLDVWERHITSIEDPDIREVALGGPDTATRAKVVWQVKVDTGADDSNVKDGYSGLQLDCNGVRDEWKEWVEKWQPANRGMLKAKGREDVDDDSAPCIISGRCATLMRVMLRRRRRSLICFSFSTSRCAVPSSRKRIFGPL